MRRSLVRTIAHRPQQPANHQQPHKTTNCQCSMVVFGKPTQATKRKGTTKMHTANVSTAVRGRGNPSSVTTRAAAQPPEKGRGGVEGKKTGKNVERTAEGLEELKKALRRHVVEGTPMRKAAAEFDGVAKKDVERYGKVTKALPEDRRAPAPCWCCALALPYPFPRGRRGAWTSDRVAVGQDYDEESRSTTNDMRQAACRHRHRTRNDERAIISKAVRKMYL